MCLISSSFKSIILNSQSFKECYSNNFVYIEDNKSTNHDGQVEKGMPRPTHPTVIGCNHVLLKAGKVKPTIKVGINIPGKAINRRKSLGKVGKDTKVRDLCPTQGH